MRGALGGSVLSFPREKMAKALLDNFSSLSIKNELTAAAG